MKSLRDIDNNLLNTDKVKAEGLIQNQFIWNEAGRKVEEEEEKGESDKVEEWTMEGMVTKVETALCRTQNSSSTESGSISYRFIKGIKDTILG